jgi:hypothetical protein
MKRRTMVLLAGVLALGSLGTACSDDGGGGDDPRPDDRVREEFALLGNEQCTVFTTRIDQSVEHLDPINDPDGYVKGVQEDSLPILREYVDVFESLGDDAPEEQRSDLAAFVDALRGAIELLENEPAVVLNPAVDPFADFYDLAEDLGFDVCVRRGTAELPDN